MMQSDDKRLFLDMQEHPENYSERQLQAMMEEIDREADAEAAWKRFEERNGAEGKRRTNPLLRFAAMLAGAVLLAGISFAAVRVVRAHYGQPEAQAEVLQPVSAEILPADTTVRFDNVRLDSLLSAVSAHYGKTVIFSEKKLRRKMLIMTWRPGTPLADLIERLNAFDGIGLSLEGDTIMVYETDEEEEEP